MKIFSLVLIVLSLIWNVSVAEESFINLEDGVQDFVLETKQIEVPGHLHAFNPSIVRWQGSLLMSYRIIPDPKQSYTCYLGVVWLDNDFNVIGEPQILDFRGPYLLSPSRAEDARLIVIDDRLFMVYDDNVDMMISKGGFRVFVAELVLDDDGQLIISNNECLSKFEGESPDRREKAWVPFDYQGNLLLAYSINPHIIFYPMLGNMECLTIARSETAILWPWGDLRGGTPAIQIDEDRYLSIFHSSLYMPSAHSGGEKMTHYFMGAYTFNADLPFGLTHISPEPIIGKNFYNGPVYKHYWKPIRAVFPCGLILDDRYLWISYGRDDHEIWVVKVDVDGLLQSLVPVEAIDITTEVLSDYTSLESL